MRFIVLFTSFLISSLFFSTNVSADYLAHASLGRMLDIGGNPCSTRAKDGDSKIARQYSLEKNINTFMAKAIGRSSIQQLDGGELEEEKGMSIPFKAPSSELIRQAILSRDQTSFLLKPNSKVKYSFKEIRELSTRNMRDGVYAGLGMKFVKRENGNVLMYPVWSDVNEKTRTQSNIEAATDRPLLEIPADYINSDIFDQSSDIESRHELVAINVNRVSNSEIVVNSSVSEDYFLGHELIKLFDLKCPTKEKSRVPEKVNFKNKH